MANPADISIPKDQWTLVAENVVTGLLWKRPNRNSRLLQTYVDTGDPAPTERSIGVPAFTDGETTPEIISSSIPIDVYLWSIDDDSEIRADL